MAKQYRSLENQGTETRKDDILRASVCAFVALTHPSKRDCNQIEDLSLSILPYTNAATKRYVAAAMSHSPYAPNALIRALCGQAPEICAPLLISSPVLSPNDLVWIVGTKSREHARIVSKRLYLPNIVIEALALLNDPVAQARVSYGNISKTSELASPDQGNLKTITAQDARKKLRDIMTGPLSDSSSQLLSASDQDQAIANKMMERLVALALHDQEGLFITALADLSGLSFEKTAKLMRRTSPSELSSLLKSFGMQAHEAYVIGSIFFPTIAANRQEIRLFIDRYKMLDHEKSKDMVRSWKAAEIALTVKQRTTDNDLSPSTVRLTSEGDVDWEQLFRAS